MPRARRYPRRNCQLWWAAWLADWYSVGWCFLCGGAGWRGDTDLKTRIEYDLYYIENWSLWLDLKIIVMTVFKGFVNKNAY